MESENTTFHHLGIETKMLRVLDKMNFVTPTPIQRKSIPVALEDQDLIGIAQTGTGKTMSFGIPMIQRLTALTGSGLILVPTRELAIQVGEALQRVVTAYQMKSVTLIGGAPMFKQIKSLRKNPDIIVATPGRLIDHLERKTVTLAAVRILVLDEADRMFDMGFAPQVKQILESVPKERQTLLYSATMAPAVMSLATRHMRSPLHIEIAPEGTTAETIEQELFIVKEEAKKDLLEHLLKTYTGSVLLFVRTKVRADRIKNRLRNFGHEAVQIHSDRSLGQRKQAIEGFKSGKFRILVATDVAARGIDVPMIDLVINYDLPDDSENYVHRIGRTGRCGDRGSAVTFATPKEGKQISAIEKIIRKPLPLSSHPEFPKEQFERTHSEPPRRGGGGKRGKFGKGPKHRGFQGPSHHGQDRHRSGGRKFRSKKSRGQGR
ncbi:MAG: DEAD/DEAH box helicase [Candidatus Omnitrophica bacterium]|nr:DEAD/DEAH box helicase [Candidatus Omnitrophota bacterium]